MNSGPAPSDGLAISFGPFRLFPARRLLVEGDTPVRLGSRAFDILAALVERAGEVVSKEDLIISKLWWAKDSHSELQLRDVRNLAAAGFDKEYIERRTGDLGLANLWQECKP